MTPASRRRVLAGLIGNFIEWYEFSIYGFFAAVIGGKFFGPIGPGDLDGLIGAYGALAIAFFFRPAGAALFGFIGDTLGRRPALMASVLTMSLSTALIGMLPSFESVGFAAPALLMLLRMLQGLSAGGEFGSAVATVVETASVGRRGWYGAWQSLTVALGLLAGAVVAALAGSLMSEEQLTAWGWRLPFIAALPLGGVALYLRLELDESCGGLHAGAGRLSRRTSIRPPGVRGILGPVALGVCRLMGWAAAGNVFLVIFPSYLQAVWQTGFRHALSVAVLGNVGFALAVLPAGAASDRWGRRPVMLTGMVLAVLAAWPTFRLLRDPQALSAIKACAIFVAGATVGLMAGPGPAMLAEAFPAAMRCTAVGLTYSLSNALFSGAAGLIIAGVAQYTGVPDVPALYVMATGSISAVALATLRSDADRSMLGGRPSA